MNYNSMNGEIITNMNSDNLLSQILSNFETQYVIDVIRDSINMRFRRYNIGMAGLNAIEQNFQTILNGLEDYSQKQTTLEVRERTYNEIIDILCRYFNLTYTSNEDIDTYIVAYYLYDFLVSNFSATIINFFTNYIIRNQDELYNQILPNISKETINNYSKKVYNNPKLVIIHSFLSNVLDNISVLDISMQNIIDYSIPDINAATIILSTISDNDNLFRDYFVCYLKDYSTRIDLITSIKLSLQQYAANDMSISEDQIVRKEYE